MLRKNIGRCCRDEDRGTFVTETRTRVRASRSGPFLIYLARIWTNLAMSDAVLREAAAVTGTWFAGNCDVGRVCAPAMDLVFLTQLSAAA